MKKFFISFVAALFATVGFAQKQDVNEDGVVNSSDVVEIYNYIATGGSSGGGNASVQAFTVNGVSFNMIAVEGGTFTMGATSEQQDPYDNEKPTHQVTLSSYYIGETEVTQALWTAVMGNTVEDQRDKVNKNWSLRGVGDNYPMYYVSWDDCQEFIEKLNFMTGKNFRLPTEAEWEYAARGGNKSKGYQYSGSNNLNDVAWCYYNSANNTHPVKTKQPNELGIYDMSGNVLEWCQDLYGDYSSGSQTNPQGPSTGYSFVVRGGSWDNRVRDCRSAYRNGNSPDRRYDGLGLRLVLDPSSDQTITVSNLGTMVSFKMIAVEGGTFIMGATPEQETPSSGEKPTHQVTLSSYYIGETEVTQALWTAVMGNTVEQIAEANGSKTWGVGKDYPMYYISWDDCQEFISKLNSLTGQRFRLPTEAEWEYAARGGNKSKGYQYSGSNNLYDVAWYKDNSGSKTHIVKTKQPNELGIYDMSGNVWEWCYDWKGDYSSSSQTNPQGPSTGSVRVNRGGSWYDYARWCRSAFRNGYTPDFRVPYLGLRLVLSE